jgi:hypothetical protein
MMTMMDLLRTHGIQYREYGSRDHHVSRGWVNIDCVYCSPNSGTFRLGFNIVGKYFCCWVCGFHNGPQTLAQTLSVPFSEAIRLWEGLGGTRRETEAPEAKPGVLRLPGNLGPLLKQHRAYLERRGFDIELVTRLWQIQGIGHASRLAWRVFIPVLLGGEVVSWTTRSISNETRLRYISAKKEEEKYPLKEILYGEWHCKKNTIIINEGPLDAWTIGPGAVATCGIGYSRAQLVRMSMYPVRVICFDNESAAQKRADKLARELAVFDGETHIVTLSGKDANSSPREEIEELRERFL